MKKLAVVIIFCLITILLCGCTEKQGDNDSNNQGSKTVIMSAQELLEDRKYSTSISGGIWVSKIDYSSLKEDDTLIIIDKISNISYRSDETTIVFDVNYTFQSFNATFSELDFIFGGDLTDKYDVGDTVRITLTVYHTTYLNETSGFSLDYEVFKEGWNQTYFEKYSFFSTNFFWQIFPDSAISKVE